MSKNYNKENIIKQFSLKPVSFFLTLPLEIQNDRDMVIAFLKAKSLASSKHIPENFLYDEEIFWLCLKNNYDDIIYAKKYAHLNEDMFLYALSNKTTLFYTIENTNILENHPNFIFELLDKNIFLLTQIFPDDYSEKYFE